MDDKENMSPLRIGDLSTPHFKSPSPRKSSAKKARSRSIGPGGLEEMSSPKRKSPERNRRKSAYPVPEPTLTSILPSKEEAAKRREARRKSLANRRVSFAPEATLHTWDVVEHMRDVTTSSASSEGSRRASTRSQWEPESDPPSTPPGQADDTDLPAEPEQQRDAHQSKRRRVSAIPPMNFNDPNDAFSSSPPGSSGSSSSAIEGSSDVDEEVDDDESDDGESTAMSLDTEYEENTQQSEETESTDSSLTQRLRQAAEMAGTRGIEYDEHGYQDPEEPEDVEDEDEDEGDMSMDMATQDLSAPLQPWSQQQKTSMYSAAAKNLMAVQDQENVNPFSPAFREHYSNGRPAGVPSTVGEVTEFGSEDMSMDMTRAVGRILQSRMPGPMPGPMPTADDTAMSMDMTRPMGGILQARLPDPSEDEDDQTSMGMDMTQAIGGIVRTQQQQQHNTQDEDNTAMSMDITRPIGRILRSRAPPNVDEDETAMSMDMTRPVGRILQSRASPNADENDTAMSMDVTRAFGTILRTQQQQQADQQPARSAVKRKHTSTDAGSPVTGNVAPSASPSKAAKAQTTGKRRRSSVGDATMDFTMAVGGIQREASPPKLRRRSLRQRRSSGVISATDGQTMEFTTAVGGIRSAGDTTEEQEEKHQELAMEEPTVAGTGDNAEVVVNVQRPVTPREPSSPAKTEVPTTPSDQERFRTVDDLSAKKLLTPLFEDQIHGSAVKDSAGSRRTSARKTPESARKSPVSTRRQRRQSSARKSPSAVQPEEDVAFQAEVKYPSLEEALAADISAADAASPSQLRSTGQKVGEIEYPTLPRPEPYTTPKSPEPTTVSETGSPMPGLPMHTSPPQTANILGPAAVSAQEQMMIDVVDTASPSLEKKLRSSPAKIVATTPEAPKLSPRLRSTRHSSPVLASTDIAATQPSSPKPVTPQPLVTKPSTPPTSSAPTTTPQHTCAKAATPEQQAQTEVARTTISDSIKLMSTPRKETGASPLKRLRNMTPKKSPAKGLTPHKLPTPKIRTPFTASKPSALELAGQALASDIFGLANGKQENQPKQEAVKVRLNDFLDMAGIRFMDITTTKQRRQTTVPTPRASRTSTAADESGDLSQFTQEARNLENAVVSAACTMPMLDLFQHSTRELKKYISEGKTFLKQLEQDVYADPPPLITAYMAADADKKRDIDHVMRDMKTHARLRSKEVWYSWRSKLLDDLGEGLQGIKERMENDERVLAERERLLESVLPGLLKTHEDMSAEAERLEEAAQAIREEEKEERTQKRDRLVHVCAQVEQRKKMLKVLRGDVEEMDRLAEAYSESKDEALAAIAEAERVKESCRGWSIDEVTALRERVSALERRTNWSLTSATNTTLTMTYRGDIQLFFDTSAFATNTTTSPNAPISLTYIAASNPTSQSLTTELRFFLQLLRAHLQCLPQNSTATKSLLRFVSTGWDTARRVAEQVRRLTLTEPVDVQILSDERLLVTADILLPKVETKVRVAFELAAAVQGVDGEESAFEVRIDVNVAGRVVYGEAYNEKNMGEFLAKRVGKVQGQGQGGCDGWAEAVRELRARLVATGRKGRSPV